MRVSPQLPPGREARAPRRRAGRARAATGLLLAVLAGGAAGAELPRGFAGIEVGARWEEVAERFAARELEQPASPWDRKVSECGYRYLEVEAERGRILVTINGEVVTAVSYLTPIEPGSDILAAADLVMRTYGQPERATLRDINGQVTLDRARARFVTVEYRRPRPVEFTVSGAPLWEYRIQVEEPQHRWYENKTLRCARAREREAGAAQ